MTEPKSYPNARDCEHGSQRGKCVNCDLAAAEKRITELDAAVDRLYYGDSGAECTHCGRITANGTCTECRHGTSPLKKAEAARDAYKKELTEVVEDRDAALARLNAAGISHAGKLDMGVTIALEHFKRLNAEVEALTESLAMAREAAHDWEVGFEDAVLEISEHKKRVWVLKEVLLKRCPKHCEQDHESGVCELTRREIAVLLEAK